MRASYAKSRIETVNPKPVLNVRSIIQWKPVSTKPILIKKG